MNLAEKLVHGCGRSAQPGWNQDCGRQRWPTNPSFGAKTSPNRPEVTKRPDLTHKRTNHELRWPCERYRARPSAGGGSVTVFPGRSLGAPDTEAPARGGLPHLRPQAHHPDRLPRLDRLVCRPQEYRGGMSDATTAIDRGPDHRAARSAEGSTFGRPTIRSHRVLRPSCSSPRPPRIPATGSGSSERAASWPKRSPSGSPQKLPRMPD